MAILDGVMFYNELDMLELRIRTLWDVVDKFIVCEADLTHSGKPKPFHLAENFGRFAQWSDKIVHVACVLNPDTDSWSRERQHRREIMHGLRGFADPGDLVVIADCDEIPRPDALKQVDPQTGARLELDFFYYNAHTRVREGWSIGCLPFGVEADVNNIRTLAGHDVPTIDRAGWHFSYFMTPEQIVDKLDSFMHHADVAANVPRDSEYVRARMEAGIDLYNGRGVQLERVPLADDLPAPLLTDPKFRGWL